MLSLSNDPILVFYINLLRKTQEGPELPEFSEIYLRLAFKAVLGKCYTIPPDMLALYRKLLVLHYCQQYSSLSSVLHIMERCFSQNEITYIIADKKIIQFRWQEFSNSGMMNKLHEYQGENHKRLNVFQTGNLIKKTKL